MEFLPLKIDKQTVYAGFWRRLGAGLIDSLIYLPIYLLFFLPLQSLSALMIIVLLNQLFFSLYSIFFNYKFGATLGKMAVGVRVTRPDGSKLELKHAFLRSIFEFGFGITYTILFFYAATKVDVNYYNALPSNDRFWHVTTYFPFWDKVLEWSNYIWISSELIVLLFNKRKRALHDFIAGTVVIKKKFTK